MNLRKEPFAWNCQSTALTPSNKVENFERGIGPEDTDGEAVVKVDSFH